MSYPVVPDFIGLSFPKTLGGARYPRRGYRWGVSDMVCFSKKVLSRSVCVVGTMLLDTLFFTLLFFFFSPSLEHCILSFSLCYQVIIGIVLMAILGPIVWTNYNLTISSCWPFYHREISHPSDLALCPFIYKYTYLSFKTFLNVKNK